MSSKSSDPKENGPAANGGEIDPVELAVMANRLEGVCREMTNTTLRTGRSGVLAIARDLSCVIVSSENELVSSAEAVPVHATGSHLLCEAMQELHPEFVEGDAFLHNDPYAGNSHAADHSILVPVFHEGEHVFTAVVKAHQADCGNSVPTTYMPDARDVYHEGALIFPCVRIQKDYDHVWDIIRMGMRRIRVPDVWFGDYLAMLGGARVAERSLKQMISRYGVPTVRVFVKEWLDYSEQRAIEAIRRLPSGKVTGHTVLDPFPGMDGPLDLTVDVEVDSENAYVMCDFTANRDAMENGLNLTHATALNAGVTGILNVLDSRRDAKTPVVPLNSGAFRRFDVRLRKDCVLGIPSHPASCSVATSTIHDRAVGMVSNAFADLGEGVGMAEPASGLPPYAAVISGYDRRLDRKYVNQLFCGTAGGPATSESDGWLTFMVSGGGGMSYLDSTEIDEQKYPMIVWKKEVRIDSEGAGRFRGAPGNLTVYGPSYDPMAVLYTIDGMVSAPKGARGGGSSKGPKVERVGADGVAVEVRKSVGNEELNAGEKIVSLSSGGGGYGDPYRRPTDEVLTDVVEGYISIERAHDAYGVVIVGERDRSETLAIDEIATLKQRADRSAAVD